MAPTMLEFVDRLRPEEGMPEKEVEKEEESGEPGTDVGWCGNENPLLNWPMLWELCMAAVLCVMKEPPNEPPAM